MRRVAFLLVPALIVACSGDPFGPEDAVGTWDLRSVNGTAIPGTVWLRDGGSDSLEVRIESANLAFASGTGCTWTEDAGGRSASVDCSYTVDEKGAVVVNLEGGPRLSGTGDGDNMTLTDEQDNVLAFRKR